MSSQTNKTLDLRFRQCRGPDRFILRPNVDTEYEYEYTTENNTMQTIRTNQGTKAITLLGNLPICFRDLRSKDGKSLIPSHNAPRQNGDASRGRNMSLTNG